MQYHDNNSNNKRFHHLSRIKKNIQIVDNGRFADLKHEKT